MPNITDQILDNLITKQVNLLRTAEGVSGQLLSEFEDLQAQIVKLLKSKDMSSYTRARTRQLMADVQDLLTEFAQRTFNITEAGAARVAEMITSRTATTINDLIGADLVSPSLSIQKLETLLSDSAILGGASLQDFWDQWPTKMTNAYADIIRNGAIYGQSVGDMIDAIEESGAISGRINDIATMVRTSYMNVANESRLTMYGDSSDLVKGFQWVSTLDANTCVECAAYDGLQWDLDYAPIDHDLPFPGATAHGNCRCTQVPVLKSFDELSDDTQSELDNMDDTTRASMDGQVAASLDYEDWLSTKSDEFQQDVLGPGRYDLWKSGKLELRDLLSQNGNPLTLDELANKLS